MVDLRELRELVDNARQSGRQATLFFDENGRLDGQMFYLDPEAGPRYRAGCLVPLLVFAEAERAKLH